MYCFPKFFVFLFLNRLPLCDKSLQINCGNPATIDIHQNWDAPPLKSTNHDLIKTWIDTVWKIFLTWVFQNVMFLSPVEYILSGFMSWHSCVKPTWIYITVSKRTIACKGWYHHVIVMHFNAFVKFGAFFIIYWGCQTPSPAFMCPPPQ